MKRKVPKCILCQKDLLDTEIHLCHTCRGFVLHKYGTMEKFAKAYSLKLKETKVKPKLKLSEGDGNVFIILGKARKVAHENNMDWDTIQTEAMQGDYDHVLRTMMKYFEVE